MQRRKTFKTHHPLNHPFHIPNLNFSTPHVLVEPKEKKYQSPSTKKSLCIERRARRSHGCLETRPGSSRFDGRVPLVISVVHTRVYTCAGRVISADKTSLFNREAREASSVRLITGNTERGVFSLRASFVPACS